MFTLLNPHSNVPILLLCEHAENKVPEEFGDLGLAAPSILNGHWAYDPPMKKVTMLLAEKIGATTVLGNYSRLVIDLNRQENDPDLMTPHYFGHDIPANMNLSEEARAQRIGTYYNPYHDQVSFQIERLRKNGHLPFILSLHSFTESPGIGLPDRPWDVGLLYNKYDQAARHFDDYLTRHHPELKIGHNEPYDLRVMRTSSAIMHGENKDLPYLLLELKNENFDRGDQTHEQWADILADVLQAMELDLEFHHAVVS